MLQTKEKDVSDFNINLTVHGAWVPASNFAFYSYRQPSSSVDFTCTQPTPDEKYFLKITFVPNMYRVLFLVIVP